MKHENTQESKFKEEIMSQLADVDLEDVDKSVLQKISSVRLMCSLEKDVI